MRNRRNFLWIFCIAAGLCLMFAGGVMGAKRSLPMSFFGYRTNAVSSLFQQENDGTFCEIEEEDMPAFEHVQIDVTSARVTVEEADDYGIEIGYYEDREIFWENKRGTLTINEGSWRNGFSLFNLTLGENQSAYVTVYCPADALDDLAVNTVSGRIEISGMNTKSLIVGSVSGRIAVQECETEIFTTETTSGGIEVRDVEADEIYAETVSGRIDMAEVSGGDVTLSTVSGRIEYATAEHLDDYGLQLSSVSGSIRVNGERVGKSEYTKHQNASAPYSLSAETVSGGIELTFKD